MTNSSKSSLYNIAFVIVFVLCRESVCLRPLQQPLFRWVEVDIGQRGILWVCFDREKWQSFKVKDFPTLNDLLCSLNKAGLHLGKLWALRSGKALTGDKWSVSEIGSKMLLNVTWRTYLVHIPFLLLTGSYFSDSVKRGDELQHSSGNLRPWDLIEDGHFWNLLLLIGKSDLICVQYVNCGRSKQIWVQAQQPTHVFLFCLWSYRAPMPLLWRKTLARSNSPSMNTTLDWSM